MVLVTWKCRLSLVLDYSRTVILIDLRAWALLVHARRSALRLSIWLRIAPRCVTPSMMCWLALLADQCSVLVACFKLSVSPRIFCFLLLQKLHLHTLLFYCIFNNFIFLDNLLDIHLTSIIFLLKTLGIRTIVVIVRLADVFSRLFLTCARLILFVVHQDLLKAAQAWVIIILLLLLVLNLFLSSWLVLLFWRLLVKHFLTINLINTRIFTLMLVFDCNILILSFFHCK